LAFHGSHIAVTNHIFQGYGQIIRWPFFANYSGGEVDDDTMTGEMQACVLDGGLHTFTAFLNGGVGKAHNGDARQAVGVIHFHFYDDTFQSHYGAGVYAGEHEGILSEFKIKRARFFPGSFFITCCFN